MRVFEKKYPRALIIDDYSIAIESKINLLISTGWFNEISTVKLLMF